jgi:DNA repair exonuclease SbcCD ATPase subunit
MAVKTGYELEIERLKGLLDAEKQANTRTREQYEAALEQQERMLRDARRDRDSATAILRQRSREVEELQRALDSREREIADAAQKLERTVGDYERRLEFQRDALERREKEVSRLLDDGLPEGGVWREGLDEEDNKVVMFAKSFQYNPVAVPGKRLILLIGTLASELDRLQGQNSRLSAMLRAYKQPHILLQKAADLMFQQYRDSAFKEFAKGPLRG